MGTAISAVGFAALIFAGLLLCLHAVGTDPGLYHRLQTEAGILPSAGIDDDTLIVLDEALADCLRGDPAAITAQAPRAVVFGAEQAAFNERERIHMEDCRRLFILLRRGIIVSAAAALAAVSAGVLLARDARCLHRAALAGLLIVLLPLGAFAVLAAADFNTAFNFFHSLLFNNDLWLLDPRTDLLIRICPASMFMGMGLRIGAGGLIWALAVPAAVALMTLRRRRRTHE